MQRNLTTTHFLLHLSELQFKTLDLNLELPYI